MTQEKRSLLLEQARRQQSAGHYEEALAGYFAALGLAADAPLERWHRVSAAAPCAIEPLLRALREIEIARIAIDEYHGAIGQPDTRYRGFSSLNGDTFARLDRVHKLARDHLARGAPAHRRAHLDMMLDIAAEDDAGVQRCIELLAHPRLLPIHPRLHLIVAQRLLAAGSPQEAQPHLEQAIRLAPCYGPAYRLLGEVMTNLGRGEAAARCFDRAAAFWNPEWWSIEFLRGMKMRVPGIVVRGHDIFYWDDSFIAVRISNRQRRLRLAAIRMLRCLHGTYRRYQSYRLRHRLRGLIAPILRLPGALWAWRCIYALTSAAKTGLRAALRTARRLVRALVRLLLPTRQGAQQLPRRSWRQAFTLWVARAEIMWGRGTALRAASLQEILDLLDRADG